jgi:RNA polymerase sigma factor (sigma-70 family)
VKTFSTNEIVIGIRQKNNDVIKYIYKEYFPVFSNFVLNNHGNLGDAEDVFQEALVAIYKNLRENSSLEINNFNAYIFGITNFIWKKRLRDRSVLHEIPLDMKVHEGMSEESEMLNIETDLRVGIYQKHFLTLDEESQKILRMFFAKTPMIEIAKIMGYSSEEYAKKRKYLAQRTLIAKIQSDPDFSET